jgi:hypothetical protein
MNTYRRNISDRGTAAEVPMDLPRRGSTDGLPMLLESDPMAVAFGYKADARTVDATRFPEYSTGQTCANCSIYLGTAGSRSGPCPIYSGKAVAAAGWCSSYAKRA